MLQLTTTAATVLSEVRSRQGVPEHYGVRVFAGQTNDGQQAVGLGFAEEPDSDDAVTETEGVKLFVAPELADPLAESIIDVEDQGGEASLIFRPQDD